MNLSSSKSKKRRRKMDDDTFSGVVHRLAADAAFYIDTEIAPSRDLATKLYRDDPLDPDHDDGATATLSTIRDTVNAVQPGLLAMFAGSQTAVEFVPRNEQEFAMAAEASDAINDIFWQQNDGFSQVLDPAFLDANVRKTGIITWWFEEKKRVRDFVFNQITEDEMDMLLARESDMEIVSKELCEHDGTATGKQADPRHDETDPAVLAAIEAALEEVTGADVEIMPEPDLYDWRVRRTTIDPQVRVSCIPPEQFIISRNATSIRDALCTGRRQLLTVSDLVSVGFDLDEVLENRGVTPVLGVSSTNNEAATRDPALSWGGRSVDAGDPSLSEVLYHDLYIRADRDGDGVAELWRVQAIGEEHYVLHAEVWEEDEPPFALLCGDPVPHRAIGNSLADKLLDLQDINTRVWRATLDSLTQSIYPRTAILEGAVNIDDVLNTEPGAIIRTRQLGAVQEFSHSFNGQAALGVLDKLEQIKLSRTGITPQSYLDPEALQSTTASAVEVSQNAAAQTIEMIARRFAEGGLKTMFAGLLRLVCRHIDEPLSIPRRDGSMGRVDPRNWNPDLLTTVNVGLGKGNDRDRLAMYQQILSYQQMIVQAAGPSGPVGPEELRNTISAMARIAGIRDIGKHIKPIPPGWQPPNPAAQPNPQLELARGQVQTDAAKAQIEARKIELDHQREIMRMRIEDEFRRDQMAQDRILKLAEIEAKYGSTLDQKEMDRQIAIEKTTIGHVADLHKSYAANAHAADQAALDRAAALEQRGLDMQHAHDTAEITAASTPQMPPATPGAPI